MRLRSRALAPLAVAGLLFAASVSTPALAADDGLVRLQSPHSVEATIARLQEAIADKGITLFADINHGANASAMDLTMPSTHLLIFGTPKIGAPLMSANPAIGIDLPVKAVVWEDADGQTWLAYNDPAYLADRHGLDPAMKPFQGMAAALEGFAAHAVKE